MKLTKIINDNIPLFGREEYPLCAVIGEAEEVKAIDKCLRRNQERISAFPSYVQLAGYRPGSVSGLLFCAGGWSDLPHYRTLGAADCARLLSEGL